MEKSRADEGLRGVTQQSQKEGVTDGEGSSLQGSQWRREVGTHNPILDRLQICRSSVLEENDLNVTSACGWGAMWHSLERTRKFHRDLPDVDHSWASCSLKARCLPASQEPATQHTGCTDAGRTQPSLLLPSSLRASARGPVLGLLLVGTAIASQVGSLSSTPVTRTGAQSVGSLSHPGLPQIHGNPPAAASRVLG